MRLRSTYNLDTLWECGDLLKAPLPRWPDMDPSSLAAEKAHSNRNGNESGSADSPRPQTSSVGAFGEPFLLDEEPLPSANRTRHKSQRGQRKPSVTEVKSFVVARPAAIRALLFTEDEVRTRG